jgi:hypothetical protein
MVHLTGVSVRGIPARIPPVPGEDRGRALAGITASVTRLIEAESVMSVTPWRYAAAGAGIGHHLCAEDANHCVTDQ